MPGCQWCQHCERVWPIANARRLDDVPTSCIACKQSVQVTRWAPTIHELRLSLRNWARSVSSESAFANRLCHRFDRAIAYTNQQKLQRRAREHQQETRRVIAPPAPAAPRPVDETELERRADQSMRDKQRHEDARAEWLAALERLKGDAEDARAERQARRF